MVHRMIIILAILFLVRVCPTLAQDIAVTNVPTDMPVDEPTDTPPPTLAVGPTVAADDNLTNAINRAENAADKAEDDRNLAINLFTIFDVIIAVITLLVVILGAFGFVSFRNLENLLTEAKNRHRQEIETREAELKDLREKSQKTRLAQSWLIFGERQYKAHDLYGAVAAYRQALALDPENPLICYRLGYVLAQQGREHSKEAESLLNKALNLTDDNFAPALAALGYVLRRRAETMLEESSERDVLLSEAELKLLKGLAFSEGLVDEDGQAYQGQLGSLYRLRGQLNKAIDCFIKATKVTPYSSYPYLNLGLLYSGVGNHHEMEIAFKAAIETATADIRNDVNNSWGYGTLLIAYLGLDRDAEQPLESLFRTSRSDDAYALQSPLNSLRQLAAQFPDRATKIQPYIERIHEQITSNQRSI